MSTSVTDRSAEGPRIEAPVTLTDPPPRTLGLLETTGLWGNLGISLLLPQRPAAQYDERGRDEGFANNYSTAVSTQNLAARLDRRVLAVVVGAVATLLALTFDITAYEPFLFLIGAVFVPLVGVFVVAYYLLPRGTWDVSEQAPARIELLLPWIAGFVAYQLTLPTLFFATGKGWTQWWTARQEDLGIDPANAWSASLVSLAVAASLTALVSLPRVVRRT